MLMLAAETSSLPEVISSRPAALTLGTSGGTASSKGEGMMMPKKLLLLANHTASRRLCRRGSISCRLLGTSWLSDALARSKPQSEQKKTASVNQKSEVSIYPTRKA